MAERDETVPCAARDWTELTISDVTTITIQNQGPQTVFLKGTAGAVKPALADPGGFSLRDGATLYLSDTLPVASFFSGVPGVTRIWAYCAVAAQVWVSHG